ncbi:hypothetical protein ACA910_003092 [Epithemia clementina (nom. ined.)]
MAQNSSPNDGDGGQGTTSIWRTDRTNFVVMSDAGKPVFARYGNESEITRICALVQALRGSLLYNQSIKTLGDIQSLQSNNSMMLVFFHVGSITMVAMACSLTTTEAFVRLQLEYLYSQLVFRLTEQVQQVFQQNTSFDLQSVLVGTDDTWMNSFLNQLDPPRSSSSTVAPFSDEGGGLAEKYDPLPFLLCGNPTLGPLSSSTRDQVSRALEDTGNRTANTLFALCFVQNRLLCLVQPEYGPHLMRSSDLHVLLHFLGRQQHQGQDKQRSTAHSCTFCELWLPICLPRFNSSGFLYCYTHCLDTESGFMLALVSHLGTTDQFQLFHKAAYSIRRQLDIPSSSSEPGSSRLLQILDSTSHASVPANQVSENNQPVVGQDVKWRRTDEVLGNAFDDEENNYNNNGSDEDYVDASGNGDKLIPYIEPSSTVLLEEIRTALDPMASNQFYASLLENIFGDDHNDNAMVHFAYRYNAPVRTKPTRRRRRSQPIQTIGYLTQCLSSPIWHATTDKQSRIPILWNMYQKLSLRLRLGSASKEAVQDALAMLQQNDDNDMNTSNDDSPPPTGVGRHCPGTGLWESPPNFTGMVSEFDGDIIYFGMNGTDFEIYFSCLGYLETKRAAMVAAKLVRRLQTNQERLFQTKPATWIEQ